MYHWYTKALSETDSSTFAFTFTITHNGHTSFSGDLNALFTCMSYEKYFEIAYISLTCGQHTNL